MWQQSFLDDNFLKLAQTAQQSQQTPEGLTHLLKDHQQRIFSFPVFTKEFCKEFVEELTHYEESPIPKSRPNTMHQYGVRIVQFIAPWLTSDCIFLFIEECTKQIETVAILPDIMDKYIYLLLHLKLHSKKIDYINLIKDKLYFYYIGSGSAVIIASYGI